jgi:hypothetical protein
MNDVNTVQYMRIMSIIVPLRRVSRKLKEVTVAVLCMIQSASRTTHHPHPPRRKQRITDSGKIGDSKWISAGEDSFMNQ